MKTYTDIEKELQEIQESWRHPKPDKEGGLRPMPKPEAEIAAISVQFLRRNLEWEIERRDAALTDAEKAETALETVMDICTAHDLDAKPCTGGIERAPHESNEENPDQKIRALEKQVARDSRTIGRWKDAEREWEAKLASGDRLRAALAAKFDEMSEIKEQSVVNRGAALAMFQKLNAAWVMAKSGTADQVAGYLRDAINFHFNGALREAQKLNDETERQEGSKDNQHITDAEEPR